MTETQFQIWSNNYVLEHVDPRVFSWHTPNELGTNNEALRRKRAALGVRKGVVDWLFLHDRLDAIELKVDGEKLKPDQHLFLRAVARAGGKVAVCYTMQDFIQALNGFGVLR